MNGGYNFTAGLVRGIVEFKQFRGERVSFGGPFHAAILRCDGPTVRVYSDVTHQWFEYDKGSGALAEADIEAFSNDLTSATGLGLTSAGRVLLSVQNLKSVEQTHIFELRPPQRIRNGIGIRSSEQNDSRRPPASLRSSRRHAFNVVNHRRCLAFPAKLLHNNSLS